MIAADYQPLHARADRRRNRRATRRAARDRLARVRARQRPRLLAAGHVAAGLLAAAVWIGMVLAMLMVPTP